MIKITNAFTRGILPAIALAFFISGGNLRADTDQDVDKAAQQLKDTEDAQKAADEREASRKQFGGNDDAPHYNHAAEVFWVVTVCVVGTVFFIVTLANGKKS